MRRPLLLLMALLAGVAVGLGSRPDPTAGVAVVPRASAHAPDEAGTTRTSSVTTSPPSPAASASVAVLVAASPTLATPLPEGKPIATLLPELRERARRGDAAAARRAHRDLNYCAIARLAEFGTNPWDARVRCIAGQLCQGLSEAEMDEAGDFLFRAAELGDVEAMAAIAEGFALGENGSIRHLQDSLALGPAYLRRALEAGVPLALATTYGACGPTLPIGMQAFQRGFGAEEQYAWAVAVLSIPGRPAAQTLAATRERCALQLSPAELQRAEARGRELHARHLRHLRDRESLARSGTMELGIPSVDADDPRLQTWPQCATDS
jgi:hypothetical protein